MLPGRRQNTTHVPHDTPTHRPSHPPTNQPTHHATAVKQQTDALLRSRTSPEQAGHTAERRNTAVVPNKITAPPPTGTRALIHARNRHPPAHPTNRQPTSPSYRQTLQPISATAVQQDSAAVRTCCYVHQQTEAIGPYLIFILKTQSIMGTLHLQRSTITMTC